MPDLSHDPITVMTFVLVFIAGILTSLTPCTYPLIPIVLSYLGSITTSNHSRLKAAVLYSLGLATVYTSLGMITALTGRVFGDLTTSWWVYLAFGVLILFLGGNMMDWYQIRLPGMKMGKSSKSAFLMGASSGLVAAPCTAPVLGSILLFVAQTHRPMLGASLLFTFSIGMNILIVLLGYSSGFLAVLPKSGQWMVRIKKTLALVMIGAGIYYIFKAGALS